MKNIENYVLQNEYSYDDIALLFSSTRQYIWKDIKPLLRFVKKNDNILDIGCGNGRLYQLFQESSIHFSGIDISKELIGIARKQYADAMFIISDMRNIPYEDADFDIVYAIASVHHLPRVGQLQTLQEVERILKTGGFFIMTNWNFLGRWTRKRIERGRYTIGDTHDHVIANFISGDKQTNALRHYWNITPVQIEDMSSKAGFRVVEQYYSKNGKKERVSEGDNLISVLKKN